MSLPLNKVLDIINKHATLEKDLSSSNLDSKTFAQKSKEYSDLNEIIEHALEYSNFKKVEMNLKIISDTNNDEEMRELARSELSDLEKGIKK